MVRIARAARVASRRVAKASPEERQRALLGMASALRAQVGDILAANAEDVGSAAAAGLAAPLLDRLRLDGDRVAAMAAAVEEIAAMPEVVGRIERRERRPNGLDVARMRIPLGVVAVIYEARPNVTIDGAALCVKAGNAAILRGGSEALRSNLALGRAVAVGLAAGGLPAEAVQVVPSSDRLAMKVLLAQDQSIDLVIPRGGEGLIRFVAEHARVPVIKHYKGVCHVYVHATADLATALSIAENAKVQRPGVCNACETILVDRAIAPAFVPLLVARFAELGVEIRADEEARAVVPAAGLAAASEDDWHAEYLDLIVALRVVDGFAAALEHIERYGSDHTAAIVTTDATVAERFLREVGSSTVVVNASTRFADGGELGLGAEIGVSTTRLHAYGPMGAEGLTTTKFIVRGTGQVRI